METYTREDNNICLVIDNLDIQELNALTHICIYMSKTCFIDLS